MSWELVRSPIFVSGMALATDCETEDFHPKRARARAARHFWCQSEQDRVKARTQRRLSCLKTIRWLFWIASRPARRKSTLQANFFGNPLRLGLHNVVGKASGAGADACFVRIVELAATKF